MEENSLYRLRHSLAHIMAQAVQRLRPGSKLGFGPPIEDGFYYDFILSSPLSSDDFKSIEKEMRKIVTQRHSFTREELSLEEAYRRIESMGEPYKAEYARELASKKDLSHLSFYTSGEFTDMCDGPHVASGGEIPPDCFKLRSLAGAYWRGDEKNVMMTRIYAWAFASKEELREHIDAYKEGLKRDHKKLGAKLELFYLDEEVGKGLPLWQPGGTAIRQEMEKYIKELEFKAGFTPVVTPHLAYASLYQKTGHLPYYKDSMFPSMKLENGEELILKPMNCPHHHKIFSSRLRSYRELPLRLSEFGEVYRLEDHGSLSGLLRVRGMCMNDGHIYCTFEQIEEEFLAVMEMHKTLYAKLGIKNYYLRFSTWDADDPKGKEKFVNDPVAWKKTQSLMLNAMKKAQLDFVEGKGEAAFYGPKIDFQIKTVTGREETASTNQLDFAVPKRLNLLYRGQDGKEHHPFVIHRAPMGTHERFTAFLIEHFAGAFPLWLAPIQVKVIAVAEKFDGYGEKIVADLRQEMVRAEFDYSGNSLSKKIRLATEKKVPQLLIIGENEVKGGTVTVRTRGSREQQTIKLEEWKENLLEKIRSRSL